jgi:hypothetical protein
MYNEAINTKRKTIDKSINWHTAAFMALFHIGAVAALFMFSWKALVAAIVPGGSRRVWGSAWVSTGS